MTLIEAIKSGRRFRRPNFQNGMWYQYIDKSITMYRSDNAAYYPDKSDILADDWETESPAVTITKEQFYEAFNLAKNDSSVGSAWDHVFERMAESLGL